MELEIKEFFDLKTWTISYIVFDKVTRDAVLIDPVLDFDPASGKITNDFSDVQLSYISLNNLKVHYILETHAHADHLSGSQYLKEKIPGVKIGIGAPIQEVQAVFKKVFNLKPDFKTDGSQFDILLQEGVDLNAGSLKIKTIFTPGHTPACASYVVEDAVFTGDSLFMPDSGTGRCDFPAGSAEQLYHSIHEKLYNLPDHFRVFVGHDYQPNGRPMLFQSSIKEQKQNNIHIKQETKKEDYVQFRTQRDKTLTAPRLLLPSIQVNIDAGHLPSCESNGVSYLKIPIGR